MATVPKPSAEVSSAEHAWLDTGVCTDKAKRKKNEDYADVQMTSAGLIALLADGMGGGADGEKFSKQAVASVLSELQQIDLLIPDARAKIKQAFAAAIRDVHNLRNSEPHYAMSGSTLVGALVEKQNDLVTLSVCNIGDSRAYKLTAQGDLQQITRDHTHYEDLLRRKVSPAEARADAQAGRLTHVLGNDMNLQTVPEHFIPADFQPGDTLILCTDGIYKRVPESEIAQMARKGNAQQAAAALVQRALAKQAQDNVTAVVVRYTAPARAKKPVMLWAAGIVVLAVLLAMGLGLGLVYGGSNGNDSAAPPAEEQTDPAQPVIDAEETVTQLPTQTAVQTTPSATLRPGQPTSTPAPTFTPTQTPTPTPTNTPVPPTDTPVPPTVPPFVPTTPPQPQQPQPQQPQPQQPTAVPPQPTAVPPQPTAVPPQPTAVPPQPTAVPPQPTAVPPQPTAVPPQPTAASPAESGP